MMSRAILIFLNNVIIYLQIDLKTIIYILKIYLWTHTFFYGIIYMNKVDRRFAYEKQQTH